MKRQRHSLIGHIIMQMCALRIWRKNLTAADGVVGVENIYCGVSRRGGLADFFGGGTPLAFPLFCAAVHIVFGAAFALTTINDIEPARSGAKITWRITLLLAGAMIVFNIRIFGEIVSAI